mmetsp:Transcript_11688/g.49000  ORF Transcript_11688/g.49000 Transcript_11688/m.49000 type:complete len:200 (-) Transcript_11688:459-1058(-)
MTMRTPKSRCICFCVFPLGPMMSPKKLYPGCFATGMKILRVTGGVTYDSGKANDGQSFLIARRHSKRAAASFSIARFSRVLTRAPSGPYTGSGDTERFLFLSVSCRSRGSLTRSSASSKTPSSRRDSPPKISARLTRASFANKVFVAASAFVGASRSHRNEAGSFATTPPGSVKTPAGGSKVSLLKLLELSSSRPVSEV